MARIKLPSDFTLERYGLQVRLVNEDDAEFIVKLRTDPKLSRFIHTTDSNVDKQKEWIREYKKREANGEDYYFVFSARGERVCLFRLYSITEDGTFNLGSWVGAPNAKVNEPLAAQILGVEIAFENLHLKYADIADGCHVDNVGVYKFSKMMGIKFTSTIQDEKGEYYVGGLTKEDFYEKTAKLKRMLGMKS
jgi:RimJ/RimL family protein N-acetyltransferase